MTISVNTQPAQVCVTTPEPNDLNSSTKEQSRRGPTRFLSLALAVIATMLVSLTGLSPAGAVTWNNIGSPGASQMPGVQGYGGDPGLSAIAFPRRYVWRSPATAGAQTVTVVVRLSKYNRYHNRFYEDSVWYTTAVIPRGHQGAWVASMEMPPRAGVGHYTVDGLIRWQNEAGRNIGVRYFDESAVGDYVCMTGYPSRCDVDRIAGRGALWFAW